MQIREIRLRNTQGLHARVAARVVKVAGRFKSRIVLTVGERRASARSIMRYTGIVPPGHAPAVGTAMKNAIFS